MRPKNFLIELCVVGFTALAFISAMLIDVFAPEAKTALDLAKHIATLGIGALIALISGRKPLR